MISWHRRRRVPGRRRAYPLHAVAVALAVCWGGCHPAEEPAPPEPGRQAILILLDAARADRFGYAGYDRSTTPTMDRLAAGGLVAPSHYAQATHTRESLPSLLYSRHFVKPLFPTSDSVPYDEPANLFRAFDGEAVSLARVLDEAGFETAAISAHSWLKAGTLFEREFGTLVDLSVETGRYAAPAEQVIDRAIEWIDAHHDADYFLYLHMMDTHFPHAFGSEAQDFWGTGRPRPPGFDGRSSTYRGVEQLDEEGRRFIDALYDGSLLHVDGQIERLRAHLAARGLDDDTLVVITSDHGEHLFETPGRFAHGGGWLEAVARVPLIVSYPGRVGPSTVPGFSESVDVAPTILRLLDVPVPDGRSMDGRDLIAVSEGGEAPREEAVAPHGLRSARYKLLVRHPEALLSSTAEAPNAFDPGIELFDLESDPNELDDVSRRDVHVVEELVANYRRRLGDRWRRFTEAKSNEPPESAFAIAARHFTIERGAVIESGDAGAGNASTGEGELVWSRFRHWRDGWLRGPAGATPIEISIPIPDGSYEATARISGHGAVALADGEPIPVPRSKAGPGEAIQRITLGRIEVRNRRFSATLHPPSGEGELRIRLFGFRPADGPTRAPGEDARHLEQLKALGYVQ